MEVSFVSRRVSVDTFHRNFYQTNGVMTPEEAQRTQKPYRYGMILLCFGALINWIGLAENYTDPFRYAGVACIIGGAFLICTAMCCWLHVPNRSAVGVSEADDNDAIHVISVADQPTMEKPPEYDTVVILDPPSYSDAIKLNPANLLQTKYYQDMLLPNYADLEITGNINTSNCSHPPTTTTVSTINERTSSDNGRRQQQNDVITTNSSSSSSSGSSNNNHRNSSSNSNSISQTNSNENNENLVNSHSNPTTVITIEQTAPNLSNEYSIRQQKTSDGGGDSVTASESTAMS